MFSWFYTQILNMYHFIDQAQATHQSYPDAGLFLLQTSAPEDKVCVEIASGSLTGPLRFPFSSLYSSVQNGH